MAEHAEWQQSEYTFQLTVLGCVLSVLGFCSISIDAFALVTRLRQSRDQANALFFTVPPTKGLEPQSGPWSEGLEK